MTQILYIAWEFIHHIQFLIHILKSSIMSAIFSEKKYKRTDDESAIKGKTQKTILPFLIFLVIVFLIAYIFFFNFYFK